MYYGERCDEPSRREGETASYPSPKDPMETLHVDHFGPLQVTKSEFKHILVIVDAFTRFTWLHLCKSTTSKEVIKALSSLVNIFGKPSEIVSDRGTAFTSKEFTKYLAELQVKHRRVAVAALWANGIVERVN